MNLKRRRGVWLVWILILTWAGFSWIASLENVTLTELDVATAAGNAVESYLPEGFVFERLERNVKTVQLQHRRTKALEVVMWYQHREANEARQYGIYLDPKTGDVLGYGELRVIKHAM